MENKESNTFMDNANEVYFAPVEGESAYELSTENELVMSNLVALVQDRFLDAENARDSDETRWLTAYHNFRGLYPKHVKFRDSEKSKVFVKVTKTKVLAAFGQLVDVVFGTGQFPIGITETKIPEGISTYRHVDTASNIEMSAPEETEEPEETQEVPVSPFDVGYEGDGKVLKAGATISGGESLFEEEIKEAEEKEIIAFSDGPSPDPQVLEISPAKEAARKMQKLIHDQIEESNGSSELRNSIFEAALFGTGIIKGPFNFNKTIGRWETDKETGQRTYTPINVRVPRIEFVSIWDFL